MNDKFIFDDILDQQDSSQTDNDFCLSEIDFYPPSDDRVWKSYVEDIEDGDNFADYCEYIFKLLDEEDYFEC